MSVAERGVVEAMGTEKRGEKQQLTMVETGMKLGVLLSTRLGDKADVGGPIDATKIPGGVSLGCM